MDKHADVPDKPGHEQVYGALLKLAELNDKQLAWAIEQMRDLGLTLEGQRWKKHMRF